MQDFGTELGVFKHSSGWLRGWRLPPDEEIRLQQIQDPEVVLNKRPTHLLIEVQTATKYMPTVDVKKICILPLQRRVWALDKAGSVKVIRYGFQIAPDFGGTAHAYCGATMAATLGDLLPWHKKPTLEDMLRACIIKNRVKRADKNHPCSSIQPTLF